jgi:signal transduction histidine kinase
LNLPGDPYDISELEFFDEFREQAFKHPFADPELSKDQWAWLISGSAPIFRKDGTADELVAVDVVVTDFVHVTNLALVPFVLFILFLLLVLCTQTAMLVRLWGSQVRLLQELDRQKDELLSIVSHQLAAPVTSIKWYLEMLQEGDLGVLKKEQQESLQSMQSVTADLSDLVGLILDVSRIQLGRMKSDRSATDLAVFFKEILAVIEPKAKEKGVHFTKMLPAHLPTVMLDKRLTRMTVENLLTNAVKYTPAKGRVELLVEKRDSTLHCEVRDTGCGIPKEEQSKIFDKLFRASNVRDKVDGNGFGLYIAKGGIESQGGKIWFESEEGKGTTFMIELPLVTAAAGSA